MVDPSKFIFFSSVRSLCVCMCIVQKIICDCVFRSTLERAHLVVQLDYIHDDYFHTHFPQSCTNIAAVVKNNGNKTPYVLLSEDDGQLQTFLVVDKTIVCEMEVTSDIPFILLAVFFVFNICYPKGCSNIFSFMEVLTLNYPSDRASATVKHFLSSLKNI